MGSPVNTIGPAELASVVANARKVLADRPKVGGMFAAIVHLDDENRRMRTALERLRAYVEAKKTHAAGDAAVANPRLRALVALPETESVSAMINVLVNLGSYG